MSIFEKGPLWHLHQGWFQTDGLPTQGKMLERLTTDGVLNEKGRPVVKIDCYLGMDIDTGTSSNDFNEMRGTEPCLNELFNYLHDHNKYLIKDSLTEEMSKRIGL